jgi:DNA-binding CsgD family transcriptional regulator
MFVASTREQIAPLREGGLSIAEIARRLRLAHPTVSYHLARLDSPPEAATVADTPASPEVIRTRDQVAALFQRGVSRVEAARRLGLSRSTVTYHARRLDLGIDPRPARRYDWAEIQRYYDKGNSVRDCMRRFGFSSYSWSAAVKRGAVVPRPAAMSIDEL